MTTEESAVAAKLFKAIDAAITNNPDMVFSAIQTYEEFLRAIELKQRVENTKLNSSAVLYTKEEWPKQPETPTFTTC